MRLGRLCRLIIIKKRSNTNFAYDLRIYKILRFQIVALPRLGGRDVILVWGNSAMWRRSGEAWLFLGWGDRL